MRGKPHPCFFHNAPCLSFNDIVTTRNDIVIDMSMSLTMSYDIVFPPDDVVNDITHVVYDVVPTQNDILIDISHVVNDIDLPPDDVVIDIAHV